jgi:hypothetical protein
MVSIPMLPVPVKPGPFALVSSPLFFVPHPELDPLARIYPKHLNQTLLFGGDAVREACAHDVQSNVSAIRFALREYIKIPFYL